MRGGAFAFAYALARRAHVPWRHRQPDLPIVLLPGRVPHKPLAAPANAATAYAARAQTVSEHVSLEIGAAARGAGLLARSHVVAPRRRMCVC